jgi:predicted permease
VTYGSRSSPGCTYRRSPKWKIAASAGSEYLAAFHPECPSELQNAQVEIIARRLAAEWAESNLGRGLRVVSDLDYRLELAGAKGIILFSAVLLLVLLSSVNVANLLLARGTHRAKEIGIRLALGAHRSRIIGQLATENILLGIAGLVGGLALGAILIKLLPSLLVEPPALQPELNFYLDSRVLCFSIFVSLMTTLLFGLLPAWNASKSNLGFAFKERLSSAEWSSRRLQPRHWLSVSQIGVSFVLLVGTSLLIGSFLNTRTLDYGITRRPLLDVWVSASGSHVPVLYREALNRLQEVSSVKAIAFASRAPLSLSEGGMSQLVTFPERSETASQPIEIKYNSISSNYLDVMGTRLIAGRAFNETDQTNGPAVALISETMAHRFWGSENPIDKVIRLNTGETEYRIVGVVQDTPINELSEVVEPYIYLPYWRNPTASMTFLLRTAGNPLGLAQSVRQKLVALSHELEPQMTTSQRQLVDYSAGPYQMTAELVSTLGLLGLLLTAVGLYGVISYGVTQRTREIGIRMALGAERSRILRLVLREVTLLGAIGLLVGLPLALFAAQSASAVLFGLSPLDVASFCTAVVPLLIVLFAAGAVPARRAARVDPMIALRYE